MGGGGKVRAGTDRRREGVKQKKAGIASGHVHNEAGSACMRNTHMHMHMPTCTHGHKHARTRRDTHAHTHGQCTHVHHTCRDQLWYIDKKHRHTETLETSDFYIKIYTHT